MLMCIPNYSNTHQHYLYDNNLRKRLVTNFGEVVARRDILKQQFYEEALHTNLESWKQIWVVVHLNEGLKSTGKILESIEGKLTLSYFNKLEVIELSRISYIETIRVLSLFTYILKNGRNAKEGNR